MLSIERALLISLLGRKLPQLSNDGVEGPNTLIVRGEDLAAVKSLYLAGDDVISELCNAVISEAKGLLLEEPVSIRDKPDSHTDIPSNDYVSLAPYWWPDPSSKSNGVYIHRDGELNPQAESDLYDSRRLELLSEVLQTFSIAAYLSDDFEFAAAGRKWLLNWFVKADTRQNPHLRHAQLIIGKSGPNIFGIIEGRNYIWIAESINILECCGAFDSDELSALKDWYRQFLSWLLVDSSIISPGVRVSNNIAFWYDLQCICYSNFTDQKELSREIIEVQTLPRIVSQVSIDGGMPAELIRSNPYDYTAFALLAIAGISAASDKLGLPIWNNQTSAGRCLSAAHEWLLALPANLKLGDQLFASTQVDEPGDSVGLSSLELIERVSIRRQKIIAELRVELSENSKKIVKLEHKLKKYRRSIWQVIKPIAWSRVCFDFVTRRKPSRSLAVVRVLGNADVYPRGNESHDPLSEVEAILKSQDDLEGVDQVWVLNRLVDSSLEFEIARKISAYGHRVEIISFDAKSYEDVCWDFNSELTGSFFNSAEFDGLNDAQKFSIVSSLYNSKLRYFDKSNILFPFSANSCKWIVFFPVFEVLSGVQWNYLRLNVDKLSSDKVNFLTTPVSGDGFRILRIFSNLGKSQYLQAEEPIATVGHVDMVDYIEEMLYAKTSDNLGLPSKHLEVRNVNKSELLEFQLLAIDDYLNGRDIEHRKDIAFIISLKSMQISDDWSQVEVNLGKTLRSILANDQSLLRIVVAGSERPDIVEMDNPRVTWVPVRHSPPTCPSRYPADKMLKRRHALSYLRRMGFEGFVVACDADDWIHHRFVEYLYKHPLASFYLYGSGLMANLNAGQIWVEPKDFYRGCGTSICMYFKSNDLPLLPTEVPESGSPYYYILSSHARLNQILEKDERQYHLVEYPVVVWVMGHSENVSGKMGKKNLSISAIHYDQPSYPISDFIFSHFRV
jgi:hypothetical protein